MWYFITFIFVNNVDADVYFTTVCTVPCIFTALRYGFLAIWETGGTAA